MNRRDYADIYLGPRREAEDRIMRERAIESLPDPLDLRETAEFFEALENGEVEV